MSAKQPTSSKPVTAKYGLKLALKDSAVPYVRRMHQAMLGMMLRAPANKMLLDLALCAEVSYNCHMLLPVQCLIHLRMAFAIYF